MNRPFWSVGGKAFVKNGEPYREPIQVEADAMKWARELSLTKGYEKHAITVAIHEKPGTCTITAEYTNGVEKWETLALDSVLLECRISAELEKRSRPNPYLVLLGLGVIGTAWAYGCAWLANLIGGNGAVAAFAIVTVAAGWVYAICWGIADKQREKYKAESICWAREVVRRVLRLPPDLRARILETRSKTKPMPWDEDMAEKFLKEIERLQKADFWD